MSDRQWIRKVSLSLVSPNRVLDLSDMHFTFKTEQADVETPNNCRIRVFNLSELTVQAAKEEYREVVLQAGYEGSFGIIFRGTIKWFGTGKADATTTYLDIMAADGDLGYNHGVVNATLAPAAAAPAKIVETAVAAMPGISGAEMPDVFGGTLPRGKVLFGMSRDFVRHVATTHGMAWGIQNGRVVITPIASAGDSTASRLTSLTGLVGIPQQTAEGIMAKCLLNPRLLPAGLVQIDNASINQQSRADPKSAPIAYNSRTALQFLARTTEDGLYRIFIVEHEGDTRGQAWYSHLTCLSVDPASKLVLAAG